MYKGTLKHVKELLLAYQELRKASADLNSIVISLRAQTGGKEKKAIRKELASLIKVTEFRKEVYSIRAYYFRDLARVELERLQNDGYSHFEIEEEQKEDDRQNAVGNYDDNGFLC